MALVTHSRRIGVPSHVSVGRIDRRFSVRVAVDAGKGTVVRRVQMAVAACGPDVGVSPGIDWEPGVVKRRSGPGCGCVACCAGSGKSRSQVIGILNSRVIRLMARVAIGRNGGVVVGDMAGSAGHRSVGAGQRERCCRVIESRTGPVSRAVAKGTVHREACLHVIGICGLVEIRQVAAVAVSRHRGVVIIHVALRAGHRLVSTGERECSCRMVECRSGPVHGAVAERAVRWERGLRVIRISGLVVVRQVTAAADARRRRKIIADVALRTGRGGVSSGKSEA